MLAHSLQTIGSQRKSATSAGCLPQWNELDLLARHAHQCCFIGARPRLRHFCFGSLSARSASRISATRTSRLAGRGETRHVDAGDLS